MTVGVVTVLVVVRTVVRDLCLFDLVMVVVVVMVSVDATMQSCDCATKDLVIVAVCGDDDGTSD